MTKAKKIPTSVSLDPELVDRLRKRAVVEERSASKVMADALVRYLDEVPVKV